MARLKIAVCGASKGDLDLGILEECREIGRLVAEKGWILITGACGGYPQAAAEGCKEAGGMSVGVSQGSTWDEHLKYYPEMKEELFDLMVYTGMGEGRNLVIVRSADVCIFVGGGSGTVMEFTIALKYKKKIGLIEGSGGVVDIAEQILGMSWDEAQRVERGKNGRELVRLLVS